MPSISHVFPIESQMFPHYVLTCLYPRFRKKKHSHVIKDMVCFVPLLNIPPLYHYCTSLLHIIYIVLLLLVGFTMLDLLGCSPAPHLPRLRRGPVQLAPLLRSHEGAHAHRGGVPSGYECLGARWKALDHSA